MEYQPLGSVEQDKIAKLVMRCACLGSWLLLDNLQLSLEIIPNLVKFLETMFENDREVRSNIKIEAEKIMLEQRRKR